MDLFYEQCPEKFEQLENDLRGLQTIRGDTTKARTNWQARVYRTQVYMYSSGKVEMNIIRWQGNGCFPVQKIRIMVPNDVRILVDVCRCFRRCRVVERRIAMSDDAVRWNTKKLGWWSVRSVEKSQMVLPSLKDSWMADKA
jgi:hypothetical protein